MLVVDCDDSILHAVLTSMVTDAQIPLLRLDDKAALSTNSQPFVICVVREKLASAAARIGTLAQEHPDAIFVAASSESQANTFHSAIEAGAIEHISLEVWGRPASRDVLAETSRLLHQAYLRGKLVCRLTSRSTFAADRHRAVLREVVEFFRDLFNSAEEAILLHDGESILYANDGCARVLSQESLDLIGTRVRSLQIFGTLSALEEPLQKPGKACSVRVGSGVHERVFEIMNRMHEVRSCTLFVLTVRDITQDSRALSTMRLDAICGGVVSKLSRDANIMCGARGEILSLNPAASRLLGIQPNRLSGLRISTFFLYPYNLEIQQIFEDASCETSVIEREIRLSADDGQTLDVWAHIHRLESEGRRYWLIFLSDLTQLRHAEAMRIHAEQLQQELLLRFSHEARTPLNGIIGFAELLFTMPLSSEAAEYVGLIRESANRISNTVELSQGLVESMGGELAADVLDLDLNSICSANIAAFQEAASRKDIQIAFEFDSKIPPYLVGDSVKLAKILRALLDNSVKFSRMGGSITLAIVIESASDETVLLRFSITDSGIGLPEGEAERLFLPFTQAEPLPTRRYEGLGLGLAVARAFTIAMRGKIWAEHASGGGTTFHVLLPFHTHKIDRSRTSVAALEANIKLSGVVLVVEDDPVNRRLVEIQLTKMGLFVLLASDGEIALRMLTSSYVDAIVLDNEMPNMGGVEVLRLLRSPNGVEVGSYRRPIAPPVVVCTASKDLPVSYWTELGVSGVVYKPASRDALTLALREVLKQRPEGGGDHT